MALLIINRQNRLEIHPTKNNNTDPNIAEILDQPCSQEVYVEGHLARIFILE